MITSSFGVTGGANSFRVGKPVAHMIEGIALPRCNPNVALIGL